MSHGIIKTSPFFDLHSYTTRKSSEVQYDKSDRAVDHSKEENL
jgi:hypothetical protein